MDESLIMVVTHTNRVGRVTGKIDSPQNILRLRFLDGFEGSFRLTDLHVASSDQVTAFNLELGNALLSRFPIVA